MIEYQVVGAYISELRKANGLTQTELAERINLTHQAVSKWENGMTLPDTETLFILSKLFKVSIDDILNANRKENRITYGSNTNNEDDFGKELTSRINEVFEIRADSLEDNFEDDESPIGHLCSFAPFLSREVLDKEFEKIEKVDLGNLIGIAPFLSREALDNAAGKIVDDPIDLGLLIGLAPFISRGKLDLLFEKVDEYDIGNIIGIAPFLSRSVIETALKQAKINNIEKGLLQGIAPFISRELFSELYSNSK